MEVLRESAMRRLAEGLIAYEEVVPAHRGHGMSREATEELALVIQSGWTLITFENFEEERALAVLEHAARFCDRKLVCWSIASGLIPGGNGAGSLDDGLKAISAEPDSAIFAILDAHRLFEDAVGVRRLRDLLGVLAERTQVVVLLGPLIDLPPEFQREAARLSLPLPGASEMTRLMEAVAPDADPALLQSAVGATLGLTNIEAVRVFRKACARAEGLNATAVAGMVHEKRAALRRTPALSFPRHGRRTWRRLAGSGSSSTGSANGVVLLEKRPGASACPHRAGCCCWGFRAVGSRCAPRRWHGSGSFPCCVWTWRPRSEAPATVRRRRSARQRQWPSPSLRPCSGSTRSRRASPRRAATAERVESSARF